MVNSLHRTTTTALLFLCVVVTVVHSFYPVLSPGKVFTKKYYYRNKQPQCSNYMDECIPWKTKCCSGLFCLNLRKGFCLSPLEPCVCQKDRDHGYDTM